MKKSILVLLSILICASTINFASAKTTSNPSLASAIKLYKAGNYSQSYLKFSEIVANDPSNAIAYYYLGMTSAQIGKKDEAINNYTRAIELAPNSKVSDYATKGKTCLETPDKCHDDGEQESVTDRFIRSPFGSGFSKEARSDFEKQKIDNMMREMNRNDDIAPSRFKDYKDFSSELPTNDEIVHALRTLQRAGLSDFAGGNSGYNSDISLLTGNNNYNYNNYEMLNMLLGNKNSTSQLSPQVIQSLLTSQMSSGF